MSTEVDVDHVIAHLRSHYPRAKYVGTDDSKLGINRGPFPLPIFQSFMRAYHEEYPYTRQRRPDGSYPPAGQLNKFWPHFRDVALKLALQRKRAEDEGKAVDEIPETRYHVKAVKQGSTTVYQTRSVVGWDLGYETTPAPAQDAPESMQDAAHVLTLATPKPMQDPVTVWYDAELEAAAVDKTCVGFPEFSVDEACVGYPEFSVEDIVAWLASNVRVVLKLAGATTETLTETDKKRPRGRAPKVMKWEGAWVPKRCKRV